MHVKCNILFIMNRGKVKFYNESKGYGFIKEDETNNEYFVHVSGLIDEVKDDDTVEFELVEGRKGLNAVNVKLA
jgi:CspA family cold shock protein